MASKEDDDEVSCNASVTTSTESTDREDQSAVASPRQAGRVHEVFGDTNLSLIVVVLVLLHLLQHALRDPCTC